MRYKTVIDSVGVRVECSSAFEQREILSKLLEYASSSNSSFFINYKDYIINPITGAFSREYFIYSHSKALASITTMSSQVGEGRAQTVFYIKIVFAGIKNYNELTDTLSLLCMLSITSWLSANGYNLVLTEFDLAIDIFHSSFENVMGLCVKRVPNVKYYEPDEEQTYDQTAYIEKINLKRKDHVSSRAYVYNKQTKEELDESIIRFELKLQPGWFNNKKTSNFYEMLLAIYAALDKYAVMYFEDINAKSFIAQQYTNIINSDIKNKSRKLKGLELDPYRLHPDTKFIEQFLSSILFTKDFHTNLNDEWFVKSVLATLNN